MRSLQTQIRERAKKALALPAAFGPDFDPALYLKEETGTGSTDEDLSRRMKEAALLSGFDPEERNRAGSYLQQNETVLYEQVGRIYQGQVEIMTIEKALEKYDWLWDYWWRAVPVDTDKYTAYTELYQKGGYFIRILPGAQLDLPIQSCLLQSENESSQRVHNIIIAEEGSRAEVISGCTTIPQVKTGMHLGVSEFFIKKGAFLSFTMVHNWAEEFHVRPRSAAILEENATFINNYLLLKPVRSLQSNPRAVLQGKGAKTRFNSIITMQNMDQSPFCPIDAGCKIAQASNIFWLPEKANSTLSKFVYKRFNISIRTAVIDYFDLHPFSRWCLYQHTVNGIT